MQVANAKICNNNYKEKEREKNIKIIFERMK